MKLQGKVALITGAGSGIGREAALLFAREGAAIAVVDVTDEAARETVVMIEKNGGRAAFCHADVSKAADCEHMIAFAEKSLGKLNVLFNIDNFEGIAARQMPDGRVRLYLISDNNFAQGQRTLLYVFDVVKR